MSDYESQANAILAHWLVAIPDVQTRLDEVVLGQLSPTEWPVVYPNGDQTGELATEEEWSQATITLRLAFLYARRVDPTETESIYTTVWAELDAVRARLWADRNLGGLVDGLEITARTVPKPVNGEMVCDFVVETRRGV